MSELNDEFKYVKKKGNIKKVKIILYTNILRVNDI